MIKKIKKYLTSLFEEDLSDIEPIEAEMSFECTPGPVLTKKVLETGHFLNDKAFSWNSLFKTFEDCEVIYNPYGCYLIVVSKEFEAVEATAKDIKKIFNNLTNPPTGLKILAVAPSRAARMSWRT